MPGRAVVAWAALAGFAGAVLLTLALALPSLLGDVADVPRLSGAMFTIRYSVAMAAAFLAGRLSDSSGLPALAFLPLIVAALAVTLLGVALKLTRPSRGEKVGH